MEQQEPKLDRKNNNSDVKRVTWVNSHMICGILCDINIALAKRVTKRKFKPFTVNTKLFCNMLIGSWRWSSPEIMKTLVDNRPIREPHSSTALFPFCTSPLFVAFILYCMWAVSFSLSLSGCPLSQCPDKACVVCWNAVLRGQASGLASPGMPLKPSSEGVC